MLLLHTLFVFVALYLCQPNRHPVGLLLYYDGLKEGLPGRKPSATGLESLMRRMTSNVL